MEKQTGTLHVVSTPIGNADDISLRAVKVLKLVDVVICEEGRIGARLLHQLRLTKPIEELHEHNEEAQTPKLLSMLKEGKSLALISDAGTPLLADPGLELVQQAVEHNIPVIAVPGASSIMTGIVTSGLPVHQFIFAGFLSRDSDERLAQLRDLADEKRTVVLLETPYRLLPLLEAAAKVLPERRAYLGCNLTMPSETRHYGTVAELLEKFSNERFKGEFVFVFAGTGKQQGRMRAEKEGGMAAPMRRSPVRTNRPVTGSRQGPQRRSGGEGSWKSRGAGEGSGEGRKSGIWKSRGEGRKSEDWKGRGEERKSGAWKGRDDAAKGKEGGWKGRSEGSKTGDWKGRGEERKSGTWKGRDDAAKGKEGGWKSRGAGAESRGGSWKSRTREGGTREAGGGRSEGGSKGFGKGGFRGKKNAPGGFPGRKKK